MGLDAFALFRQLADRSQSEREQYYAQHQVPAELRAEVESLLSFDDTSDDFRKHVAAAALDVLGGPSNEPALADTGEGRFPAGTLLGSRYRIVTLLGRGGMGEVYRASDLTLNQAVALKFLPMAAARDQRQLAHLREEVRLARTISHPNVCRVYDIGELDGSVFISMEYVDGEDLGSLLRRIGRLPHDKALEVARGLCAGLAAAHQKGVVHRDLKPSNILIDGRGQVCITDFGLASTLQDLPDSAMHGGTPGYMAPEQQDGRQVSVRSDIFSLGAVLYEMFTGRRALEPPTWDGGRHLASSVDRELDPAVARTIKRCLEPDPRDRPDSALAVAAALPGSDPLAEALAAGVTPSPQIVAAARATAVMSVRAAVLLLICVVGGLVTFVLFGGRFNILRLTPFENPPEVLAQRGREIVAAFGYAAPSVDRASSFYWAFNYQRYAELRTPRSEYQAQLADGQPPLVFFWYRQSPEYLTPLGPTSILAQDDPPVVVPGEVLVWVDQRGRLVNFQAVAPADGYSAPSDRAADWSLAFTAAGLDRLRFTPDAPQWIPPVTFDARAAWTGTLAHAPSVPMRIEAAAWKSRLVYFRLIGPWTQFQGRPVGYTRGEVARSWLISALVATALAGAALLAWRNHSRRRGDAQGAVRLATLAMAASLIAWLVTAHHVIPDLAVRLPALFWALGSGLCVAASCWVLYMALEPFVRRRWPRSLITWTRLLQGRVRDPSVGGHILTGTTVGVALAVVSTLRFAVLATQGVIAANLNVSTLNGIGGALSAWLWNLVQAVGITLLLFVLFLLLRVMLRRDWAAAIGFVVLVSAPAIVSSYRPLTEAAFMVPVAVLSLWMLIRLGVLPMILAEFVSGALTSLPITANLSTWYSYGTMFALVTVLALAIWSFAVTMAGRSVLRDELLDGRA